MELYNLIKEKMEDVIIKNKIEVTEDTKESAKEKLISLTDFSNNNLIWYFDLQSDMQSIIECARKKFSAEEIVDKIASQNMQPLLLLVAESMYDEVATDVIEKQAKINKTYQLCKPYELSVRKKLIDYFADDYGDAFETMSTKDIIDNLYDSYCDDSFWSHASVTLEEIVNYFYNFDIYEDDDHTEMLGSIAKTYFLYYKDLIR